MKIVEKFEMRSVSDLIPYVKNSKQHPDAQVAQLRSSLREFGFLVPLLIDGQNNVICGHGRLLAAQAEGLTEVPVIVETHLTDTQRRAFIIADNKLTENGGWDADLLSVELEDLAAGDFDLSLLGFDAAELDKLLGGSTEGEDDGCDIDAELEKPSFAEPGDLWLLGRHRLVCGDSTLPETYNLLMPGEKANLVLTDPPYGVDYSGHVGSERKGIQNDSMGSGQFYDFLLAAFQRMRDVMAADASIYVFHADTEGLNFRKAFVDAGFKLSEVCIWVKNSLVMGRNPYHWQHEPCLFGWRRDGKHKWFSDRKQSTVWNFDRPSKSADHPTMKPVPLLCYPIGNSTTTGGIVLDPFAGSFSTGIACVQTDRVCYAIELDPQYVSVGVRRYISAVGGAEDVFVQRGGEKIPFAGIVA